MLLTLLAVAADLVLVHGRIWTGDPRHPQASSVAVWHGRVLAVDGQLPVGPDTRVIELRGRRMLPGFRDSHVHLLRAGLNLSRVALKDAANEAELGDRLRAFDAKLPASAWMQGGSWDHDRALGGRLPTKELIDSWVRDRPVWLRRYDGHMGVANTRALELAGISAATPDPPGGLIVRRPGSREPTGVLRDSALALVEARIPPPGDAEIAQAVAAALQELRANGVTAVEDMDGTPLETRRRLFREYQALARRGELTARVQLFWPIAELQQLIDLGAVAGFGDEWVRIGGVKAYVDGSIGASTAKMFTPYLNEPGTSGIFVTEPARLRELIARADLAGLQVAAHAIGDRANAELLDVFAAVERSNGPRDRRFRDEHVQHLRAQDIPRFAKLGVVASMQPYHVIDDGRFAESRLAPGVLATSYAYRSLLDAGARLAFGSDWPVAPVDALAGIEAAVYRRTLDGKHPDGWFPAQRIAPEEAVAAYTRAGAWAAGRDRDEGTIEPGKVADFVVLTRDVLHETGARVAMTISGGRVVYERQ